MGSGFRTFQSGEVLTAANVQDYLMDQSVMVFAGTAARSSAIATPETGMLTYRTDGTADAKRQGFEFYDGSAYVRLINPSGLEFISSTTIGSAVTSVTVSNAFSSTYDNYRIIVSGGACSTSDAGLTMTLGAKVTGYKSILYYQDWGAGSITQLTNTTLMFTGRTGTDGHSAVIDLVAPNLAKNTSMVCHGSSPTFNSWGLAVTNDTTQYTAFTLDRSAGTLTGGTIKVYGYRN